MLMKTMIEIFLRPDELTHYQQPYEISLYFTKMPTHEQLVEATRHYLTDLDFGSEIGLIFMKLVQETDVPELKDYEESEHGCIFADTNLVFVNE